MTPESAVLTRLKAAAPQLRQHAVSALWVFGSVARGEAHEGSDVDILVDFSSPVSLMELGRLKRLLEELLGRRVDLIVRDGLRPALRDRVMSEAIRAA